MTNQCAVKINCILPIWVIALSFMVSVGTTNLVAAQEGSDIDQGRVQKKFQQIDSNSDGVISSSEMIAHETLMGKSGGNRFKQTDTDKDGTISMDEFIQHEIERSGQKQRRQDEPSNEKKPPSQ